MKLFKIFFISLFLLFGLNSIAQSDPNADPNWDWRVGDKSNLTYPAIQYKMYELVNGIVTPVYKNAPWSQPNAPDAFADNKKEDGWVLVARDFGTPERAVISNTYNAAVPYLVLYNKFKSVLRVFVMCNTGGQNYEEGGMSVNWGGSEKTYNLAHYGGKLFAIDQPEEINVEGTMALCPIKNNYWAYGDFAIAYDPTINKSNSETGPRLTFELVGITRSDVTLSGEFAGTTGTKQFVEQFMTGSELGFATINTPAPKVNKSINLKELAGKVSGTAESYRKQREEIKHFTETIPTYKQGSTIGNIVSNFKSVMQTAIANPIFKALPTIGGVLGLLDYFSSGSSKIQEPLPTYMYANMKLNGTITTTHKLQSQATLPIPGSRFDKNATVLGSFVPLVYNNSMGFFHLNKTPVLLYKEFDTNPNPNLTGHHYFCDVIVKGDLDVAFNAIEGLELENVKAWIEVDLKKNIKNTLDADDEDIKKFANFVLSPDENLEVSNLSEGAFIFKSKEFDIENFRFQSIKCPTGFATSSTSKWWGGMATSPKFYIKVKAEYKRTDVSNSDPVVVVQTFNVQMEDRGEGIWPKASEAVQININKQFEFGLAETKNDFGFIGEYTSIQVEPEINKNNVIYKFAGWSDGNNENPRNYIPTANSSLTALYKVNQKSSDASAYTNNSQKKIVRTMDGWLHQVYSSMNHVWIEHKSPTSSNWILGNNGQPLDNGEGKNPSIDWWHKELYQGMPEEHYLVVAFQQKENSAYSIRYSIFKKENGNYVKQSLQSSETLYLASNESYTSNANPNITVGGNRYFETGYFALTFEKKNASDAGIYWIYGQINSGGVGILVNGNSILNYGVQYCSGTNDYSLNKIPGTNANSINASVSKNKFNYNSGGFDVVYEQYNSSTSSAIKDALLSCTSTNNVWNPVYHQTDILSASTGAVNQKPSMVQMPDGNIKVCWIRNVTTQYVIPYYINAVYYNSANSQYIYSGIFARNVSINTSNNNAKTLFAWSQDLSGWENYISNGVTNIKLNTTGQDVQVCNGTETGTNMLVSSFNRSSAPYYFTNTGNIGGSLSKAGSNINCGRGLALNKDDMQFSYTIKSLSVAGTNIHFTEIPENAPDTSKIKNRGVKYLKLDELNKYLLSEPFSIQEGTAFEFSDDAGFIDAETAAKALGEKGSIKCKIELIEDATNKTIGLINESEYTAADLLQGKITNYTLNTEGLKNTMARVKITISSNIEDLKGVFVSEYGTLDKGSLAKASATELTLKKEGVVTEYALEQNYPNPFNPSTTIKYQIPENGMVTLKIFNILGEEVATLVNGFKASGRYEVKFDASNLASGVYVYRLSAGDFNASHKMLLLK